LIKAILAGQKALFETPSFQLLLALPSVISEELIERVAEQALF